ncbi:MAG: 50S ribosomal protein L10 [Phycisphaerae bacterium]|nr:50S ribosomal protein L10 [Phycisphaerae bacterium]
MSKTIKTMIIRDYKARLAPTGAAINADAMVIGMRGLTGIQTTKLRSDLAGKKIRVVVVRNALARGVIKGTRLEPLTDLLSGSSALAYSTTEEVTAVEIARELVSALKAAPKLELKGAVLDGTLFSGKQAVEELAKFPTRDEALANLVAALLGPGKKLSAQLKGPGAALSGVLKTIEDKLEKGEAVGKAS